MYQATEQQIQEWKNKHKDIFLLTSDDKACYVRKPSRKDVSYAMAASSGGKDLIKMQEVLLNNCWLGGDEEMRTDDDYFYGVSPQLTGLMEAKEVELKKL